MSIRFVRMREEHLEQVLRWRTQPDVTRFMYTDIAFDMDRQRAWFARVSQSPSDIFWIVELKGEPAGVVSLNQIDAGNKRAYWANYIGEPKFRTYGGFVPYYVYNYVFFELGLQKLMAEVMEGNTIRKLHLAHGCREVGVMKNHIFKYDQYHDVFLLEMLKADWDRAKFAKYVAEFE